MHKALIVPGLHWLLSIESWYPEYDEGPRWGWTCGRMHQRIWWIPLWRWQFTFDGRPKSVWDLVGIPKIDAAYMLDEFDSCFNHMAVGSLRYHMNFAVTWCSPEQRARYTALAERLSEEPPHFTEDELAVIKAAYPSRGRDRDPAAIAVFDAYREREDAYLERIRQARHDFVDLMPELWS